VKDLTKFGIYGTLKKVKQKEHGTYFTVNSGATKRLAAVSKTAPCALLFTSGTSRIILQNRTVNVPMT
jgi:hypothetical protein